MTLKLFQLLLQYAKFGIVGISATAIHAGVFTILIESLTLRPLTANILAFSIAVFVSYLGNFVWTFKHEMETDGNHMQSRHLIFARFFVVAIIGLCLNSLAVYLIVEITMLPYFYAIIPMVGIVPIVIFVLNKFWTFRSVTETVD